jgi:hypothetical protein
MVEPEPCGVHVHVRSARGLLDERFLLVLGDTYLDIRSPSCSPRCLGMTSA